MWWWRIGNAYPDPHSDEDDDSQADADADSHDDPHSDADAYQDVYADPDPHTELPSGREPGVGARARQVRLQGSSAHDDSAVDWLIQL